MSRVDLARERKDLYRPPSGQPVLVDVPLLQYLMIDGHGDPNTSADYSAAVEALYAVSYALKFALKKAEGIDYKVMPLEGQWWTDDMRDFSVDRKDDWSWTLMIVQPPEVTAGLVETTRAELARKKRLPALADLRLEELTEGLCAQIMHLGPYADEGPTVVKLHAFIADSGHRLAGKHHEIYLSDPRRAAPERLKTVLRQPVVSG